MLGQCVEGDLVEWVTRLRLKLYSGPPRNRVASRRHAGGEGEAGGETFCSAQSGVGPAWVEVACCRKRGLAPCCRSAEQLRPAPLRGCANAIAWNVTAVVT